MSLYEDVSIIHTRNFIARLQYTTHGMDCCIDGIVHKTGKYCENCKYYVKIVPRKGLTKVAEAYSQCSQLTEEYEGIK